MATKPSMFEVAWQVNDRGPDINWPVWRYALETTCTYVRVKKNGEPYKSSKPFHKTVIQTNSAAIAQHIALTHNIFIAKNTEMRREALAEHIQEELAVTEDYIRLVLGIPDSQARAQ